MRWRQRWPMTRSDRAVYEANVAEKMYLGILFLVLSTLGFVAIGRMAGGDLVFDRAPWAPFRLWWALTILNGVCLLLGLVWTVRGLRVFLPPTTMLYRITEPERWRELFTRRR
jgi:hypothetical protein